MFISEEHQRHYRNTPKMFGRFLRRPPWFYEEAVPEHNDNKDESAKPEGESNLTDDTQETPVVTDPYQPTVLDVIVVKAMLNKAFHLPNELVDTIIDLGEYWPHTSTEIIYSGRPRLRRKDARGGHPTDENKFLLRTPPLGFVRPPYLSPEDTETQAPPHRLQDEYEPSDFQDLVASPVATRIHPCRKIVFTMTSRDQGWGGTHGEGPYRGSWTWFEAGLERCNKTKTSDGEGTFSPVFDLASLATLNPPINTDETSGELNFDFPLLPREDCKIQANVMASRDLREHRVVWSFTDEVGSRTEKGADGEAATGDAVGAKNSGSAGSGSTEESSADGGAAAEVFESAEVRALEDAGRGKATGDGEFVRNLKLGDIVTVWAKARFPGWVNEVERIKVEVYWAI